jgi:acetolactate synthase I/III small subunit
MLVKVKGEGEARARILEICDVFRVRVLDVTHRTITIEGTGTPVKLEALLELLRDFGIVELSRTGRIALARGDRGIKERSARLRAVAGSDQEWTGGGV